MKSGNRITHTQHAVCAQYMAGVVMVVVVVVTLMRVVRMVSTAIRSQGEQDAEADKDSIDYC